MDNISTYGEAAKQIGFVMAHQCMDSSEVKLVKKLIQDSYNTFAAAHHNRIFLNLGFWNKKIFHEYKLLNFNFSAISEVQDVYSQLLLYFLIRPLIKNKFFNKRLLEVGCGNGLGLKASSKMLSTKYALGVDLVPRLLMHSKSNFFQPNVINFLQGDAENLPVESGSFDIVTNLESSHLYPQLESFFAEVERVLSLGGFFCYADHNYPLKNQAARLENFIKDSKLKIIQKVNITKWVQASLYRRLILNEEIFYQEALSIIGTEPESIEKELPILAAVFGLIFLPWWKIKFKNPDLKWIAKFARKNNFWGKKYYFCYLLQKINN